MSTNDNAPAVPSANSNDDTQPSVQDPKPNAKSSASASKAKGDMKRDYVHEIVDANTRIAVRIQKTERYRPYYSMLVGRFVQHENGESFVPYIPVRAEVSLAKVQNITDHSKLIASLIHDAIEWIRTKVQEREDEIIGEQQRRESEKDVRSRRGEQQAKPGLKTLAKIDRQTKHYGT